MDAVVECGSTKCTISTGTALYALAACLCACISFRDLGG
jgi:hypothetical protein